MLPAYTFYVVPVVLFLWGVRKWSEHKWGTCKNNEKLHGKIALVTGASSGIGFQIAKELAARQAQVVMACKNLSSASKAITKLKKEIECSSVVIPMELDLASIKSIKRFCEEFKATYTQLHILVNNAGVAYPDPALDLKTRDGLEIHFGVNHLGHFLLTNLLLDNLKAADESRIVIVSSQLHEKGTINIDDLNLEKSNRKLAYSNSKLANVYFGKELAKRLKNTGSNVYVVCPGWVCTNLFRHYKWKWYEYILVLPVAFMFMRSAKQGAQTAIHCATEPSLKLETGYIYRNCKRYESKIEIDNEISKRLWSASEELLNKLDP